MEKEKRKGKRSSILIIVIFLIGLSLLLYPSVGTYINHRRASETVKEYTEITSELSKEEVKEIFSFAEEYNRLLFETEDSFYVPSLVSGYESALDITGTGIMGYLNIESIGVELPIYHTVDEMVLQVGVGHLPGSSLPVGGQNTHAVLSGHRGVPGSKLFTDLDKVQIGDIFTITTLDRVLTYEVDQIKTVLPRDVNDLQIVPGMDYCTLLTCTPYGINTHRLLVRGVRKDVVYEPIVTDTTGETDFSVTTTRATRATEIAEDGEPIIYVANEAFRIETFLVMALLAVPMLAVMLIYLIIKEIITKIFRHNRHDKNNPETLEKAGKNPDNEKSD